ncbi:hypothetical protein [Oceanicoccus sp. KOV_DT_Chl]|uniref:hypothetical protein n=1 Tax=Oceanicoccus sp. KOV_DT_Chl TaxID=1904639 RepID=UPI0013575DF7|nr:hypothetical protein [Oceanicoccus sp. KOV_DT_Chl]
MKLWVANTLAAGSDYRLDSNIAYGHEKIQRLDIYAPLDALDKPRPVVVFFYGGCWGRVLNFKKSIIDLSRRLWRSLMQW